HREFLKNSRIFPGGWLLFGSEPNTAGQFLALYRDPTFTWRTFRKRVHPLFTGWRRVRRLGSAASRSFILFHQHGSRGTAGHSNKSDSLCSRLCDSDPGSPRFDWFEQPAIFLRLPTTIDRMDYRHTHPYASALW